MASAHKDPRAVLERFVLAHGTQAAAAKALDISSPYLGDLRQGKRSFSLRILAALGLERVVIARRMA